MLLTLDSCVVFAAVKREELHDLASIDGLFSLATSGRFRIQLTEAFNRDMSRKSGADELTAERDAWLADSPVLPTPAGGVSRIGVSLLDSNDMLCDKDTAVLNDKLVELLPPKGADSNPSKAYSDIDHLLAHAFSGADVFVTVDERTILNKQQELWGLGLRVLRPSEALRWILGSR
ncbi:MAG: hypothetical protein F2562_08995 [Actinobacteria bacterium]|nr:hypothetical protein [Actinomycetota bacterium]